MTWQYYSADPERQWRAEQSIPVARWIETETAGDDRGTFVMLADHRRVCGNPTPTRFPWLFWQEMENYYTG